MNEMERLRHFVREIEELTALWQELVRFSVPAKEIAVRRHALIERLESLAHEMSRNASSQSSRWSRTLNASAK